MKKKIDICWYSGLELFPRGKAGRPKLRYLQSSKEHLYAQVLGVPEQFIKTVRASSIINSILGSCPINLKIDLKNRLNCYNKEMLDFSVIHQEIYSFFHNYRISNPNKRRGLNGFIWEMFWDINIDRKKCLFKDYVSLLDKIETEALHNKLPYLFD